MNRTTILTLPVLLAVVLAIGAGCDSETGMRLSNLEPNTRISAGPPEATDTGYNVELYWFGWDDDGFVDYYEIAWETPEEWLGPIFTNDSLFSVQAAESCCVEDLPDFDPDHQDEVYEQYHTFYVRAVDDRGVPDPTPAARSFNSKTIAPNTRITSGPSQGGSWGTSVEFEWVGEDDDGFVVAGEYVLSSLAQFRDDHGGNNPTNGIFEVAAWLDTLTFRPLPGGGYSTERVWKFTETDSVLFPALPVTSGNNQYFFCIRSIDNAGAKEKILEIPENLRGFRVRSALDGPRLTLISNIVGTWTTADPPETRDAFAGQGLRFRWTATPGPSEAPIAGFSYAIDDTSQWSPFSLNSTEWPVQIPDQPPQLYYPEAGFHSFFLRAIDAGGFIRLLVAKLQIYSGPRFCPPEDRIILIVTDVSDGQSLSDNIILPPRYYSVERGLIDYWFDGYDFQVHWTRGDEPPEIDRLDCATTVFWITTADIVASDQSVLEAYHREPPNVLPSYFTSGGNLVICGTEPLRAMAYFEQTDESPPEAQSFPVNFAATATDETLVEHWAYSLLGIRRVEESIGNTNNVNQTERMYECTSQIRTGPNPYPDLAFDPLTWPQGPELGGFGYFNRGIKPALGSGTEIVYTWNGGTTENEAIAVRRLTSPGLNSNMVLLGFHPYFIERPLFRQLVRAILTDFGESPEGP